jgi:hypothetical protein
MKSEAGPPPCSWLENLKERDQGVDKCEVEDNNNNMDIK